MKEGENGTIPLHKYLVKTSSNKRSTLKAVSKGKYMHKRVNLIKKKNQLFEIENALIFVVLCSLQNTNSISFPRKRVYH